MAYSSNLEPDQLTALTSLDSGDVIVVGDISDSSEAAKMITKANFFASPSPLGATTPSTGEFTTLNASTPGTDSTSVATLQATQSLTNKTLTSDTNKLRYSKTIVIEDPTNAEDISFFFSNRAITITEMRAVLIGSTPSVTWTIRHGTDRSATGAEVVTSGTTTTSTTSGSDVTSFNDATIVADSFVWLETTAESGTTDELQVTVFYTED